MALQVPCDHTYFREFLYLSVHKYKSCKYTLKFHNIIRRGHQKKKIRMYLLRRLSYITDCTFNHNPCLIIHIINVIINTFTLIVLYIYYCIYIALTAMFCTTSIYYCIYWFEYFFVLCSYFDLQITLCSHSKDCDQAESNTIRL